MTDFHKNLMDGIYANSPDLQKANTTYVEAQIASVEPYESGTFYIKIRGANSTETKWLSVDKDELVAALTQLKVR